jgi:hypothetical protein
MDLGAFGDVLLLLDVTVIVFIAQVSFLFLWQNRRKPNKMNSLFGIVLTVITIAFVFRFEDIYYGLNPLFNQIYYFGLAVAIFIFAFSVEWQYRPILKTKWVFTTLTAILVAPTLIFSWNSPIFVPFFVAIEITYLFPLYFFFRLYAKNRGTTRRKILMAIVGFLFLMAGVGGNTDVFQSMLIATGSLFIYSTFMIVFKTLMIAGLCLFYYAFANVFLETNWRSQLLELYIIHSETKDQLYYQNFQISDVIQSQSLFSSGIVGITEIFKEFTSSEKFIRVIDQGSIKLIIEKGSFAIGVFVVRQNLKIYRQFLKKILKEFEVYYGSIAEEQRQDPKFFGSVRTIINMILSEG